MVFVLKPLTQAQQTGEDIQEDYKHKESIGDLWRLCCMGRTLYYNYQSRCSTLAIDAQSSMLR